MERNGSEIELPGFRFHPTEEEILDFYLRRAAGGRKFNFEIIATVNLYRYDPWDLPAMAKMGEREWYFFVPRDRRQGNGGRPNRTTERGFWKATGSDRHIRSSVDPRRLIGLKKTLVYYRGRAPRGTKTDWIMNEYRLPDASSSTDSVSPIPKEDIVLCKVYRKATPLRELEQRAAMEEETRASMADTSSTSSGHETLQNFNYDKFMKEMKEEQELPIEATEVTSLPDPAMMMLSEPSVGSRQPPSLPEIQVPSHGIFDWSQDPFINQLRSPWLEQWSPLYAQMLNF